MSKLRRIVALTALIGLAACGQQKNSSLVDVQGLLPRLSFAMTRSRDAAAVTGETYRGRVVALYFGYTHCPDLCPMTLGNLSQALARLGPLASRVAVLFVTVDPARDDLPSLRDYAASFGPGIDGLRGTADQIVAITRRYRVAYGFEPKNTDGDYDVSHSSAVFLFDGNGTARIVATTATSLDSITNGLRKLATESSAVATAGSSRQTIASAPG